MVKKSISLYSGTILEEENQLTLSDLCCACEVHAEQIIELVEEGILEPSGVEIVQWRFSGVSLVRARAAIHLQKDLAINPAGVALALDLMDEIENLRKRLKALESSSF